MPIGWDHLVGEQGRVSKSNLKQRKSFLYLGNRSTSTSMEKVLQAPLGLRQIVIQTKLRVDFWQDPARHLLELLFSQARG